MHLDRWIVRTYIWTYGLSTGPYEQNTLTRQSADMNDTPQGPASLPRYTCPHHPLYPENTDKRKKWKSIRVYEDGALEKSTYVTNLLIEELKISMEITGGDASWLNDKNKRHNISIHNMVREIFICSNKHEKNCAVQQRHHQKSINVKYTVH